MIKTRRGFAFVDVIVTLALLAAAAIVFSATLPAGIACSRKAQEYRVATAIAQRKLEQLRAANYESLTGTLLQSAGIIDSGATSSPYSFTTVDGIPGQLAHGTGSVVISDTTSSIRTVRITVRWQDRRGNDMSYVLTSRFADKRPRAV